jgi:hypothetical protein
MYAKRICGKRSEPRPPESKRNTSAGFLVLLSAISAISAPWPPWHFRAHQKSHKFWSAQQTTKSAQKKSTYNSEVNSKIPKSAQQKSHDILKCTRSAQEVHRLRIRSILKFTLKFTKGAHYELKLIRKCRKWFFNWTKCAILWIVCVFIGPSRGEGGGGRRSSAQGQSELNELGLYQGTVLVIEGGPARISAPETSFMTAGGFGRSAAPHWPRGEVDREDGKLPCSIRLRLNFVVTPYGWIPIYRDWLFSFLHKWL